jgi:hypothetical protein
MVFQGQTEKVIEMKGKPWTGEEEKKLRELINKGASAEAIAGNLGKSKNAVYQKCLDLGLKLKEEAIPTHTSSSLKLPKDLPSLEETLRILAAALKVSKQSGLDRVEVQRLQVTANLAKTYEELLDSYVQYRKIEAKLIEMEEKYERLAAQAESNTPKPDIKSNAAA